MMDREVRLLRCDLKNSVMYGLVVMKLFQLSCLDFRYEMSANRTVVVEVQDCFQQKAHSVMIDVTHHRYRLIQLFPRKKIKSMVSLVVRRHRTPNQSG